MKRKSLPDALSDDNSARRRRTRSSGPLVDTQPLFSPSKTRTSPSKRSTAFESANAHSGTDARETSSLKENEAEDSDDADELNLSPSKSRRGRSARRVVMDSVELTTPSKRRHTHPSHHDTISPTPALFKNSPVNHAPASLSPSAPSRKRTTESPHTTSNASAASAEAPKPTTTSSPIRLPRVIPSRLLPCLNAQKRAILAALQNPPDFNTDEEGENGSLTNTIAAQQLFDLLTGTVTRGEGNSCLVLGPRGSGKTRVSKDVLLVP
jgi:origin recognition complex subunit 4